MQDVRALNELVAKESAFVDDLLAEIGKVIVGQTHMVERHPDRPLGRRPRAARGRAGAGQDADRPHRVRHHPRQVLARPVHAGPACRPTSSAPSSTTRRRGEFTSKLGPIFANLVLADEINRAPAKVQSALLEAMQERQVTIGDTDATACPIRSWSWRPRTRSSRKAPIPLPGSAGRSLHADGQGRLPVAARKSARSWTA